MRASSVFLGMAIRCTSTLSMTLQPVERPPMTLLGGFLGAGKTTTLTHLLTNRDGLRVAVLVNDVAAVNVDAMAIRRSTVEGGDGVEMVQLENGCVCCSAAGDLAPAVEALLANNDPFDHVVIELSGVADPANVQASLGLGGVSVDRKVALVDASSFPELFGSIQSAGEREDLTGSAHGHSDDTPQHSCVVDRPVVELLLQQIETADVILANKVDLATEEARQLAASAALAAAARPGLVCTVRACAVHVQCLGARAKTPKPITCWRCRLSGTAAHATRLSRAQREGDYPLHVVWRRDARGGAT